MAAKLGPCSMKLGFDLTLTDAVSGGDLCRCVQIEVAPQKDQAGFLWQSFQETLHRIAKLDFAQFPVPGHIGDAGFHLLRQGNYLGIPLCCQPPVQTIKRDMSAYGCQKGIKILRALGRNCFPGFHIRIIHAFFCVLPAIENAVGEGIELSAIGGIRLLDGLLIALEKQSDDVRIFHAGSLLSAFVVHPNSRHCAFQGYTQNNIFGKNKAAMPNGRSRIRGLPF